MKHLTRLALLTLCAAAVAAPGRHLRYAESTNRLVFAFVFGHADTCRVIRRRSAPQFELAQYLRRPPSASFKGDPGDKLLTEFSFRRFGRPVHLAPLNDGKHLLSFANRAPTGGWPKQDRIVFVEERGYAENIDYAKMPSATWPEWPPVKRELAPERARKRGPETLGYAFLTRESGSDRVLVARQAERKGEHIREMVCFAVVLSDGDAVLPEPGELAALTGDKEPLWRAGAAWALGHGGKRDSIAVLKGVLSNTDHGAARATIARALVQCGDVAGRRTLRVLLTVDKDPDARREAALALAQLPPDKRDADALAEALEQSDPDTAELIGMSLARLGKAGMNALLRASRASRAGARAARARVLGHVDESDAEKRLLTLVRDPDDSVQSAAALALTNPPRAILPENHADFARALDACRRSKNKKATRRLCVLAAHATIHHEQVLKALVALAATEPKAIWSLRKLSG